MQDFQFTAPDFEGGPIKFLGSVREELKKVTWPTRAQVITMTGTVIVVSFAVGLYIGGLDYGFTQLMSLIIKK